MPHTHHNQTQGGVCVVQWRTGHIQQCTSQSGGRGGSRYGGGDGGGDIQYVEPNVDFSIPGGNLL